MSNMQNRLSFIAGSTLQAPTSQENGKTPSPLSQMEQAIDSAADKVAQKLQNRPPLMDGTWGRRLVVGGIVLAGVGAGVGTTLAIQHYRGKDSKKSATK